MFLSFCMVVCETSMLLFVSVWCYAKPRCYYSCPYGVMPNLDAIIRVSNYVRLNVRNTPTYMYATETGISVNLMGHWAHMQTLLPLRSCFLRLPLFRTNARAKHFT